MIRLIAAIDQKRGIAKQGFQPWYIPDDEHYFSELTKQHGGKVLVGSITYRTFKGPLEGRTNYVLSRQQEKIAGAEVVKDIEKFFHDHEDVWVIGGANVFAEAMELGYADELYLTKIEADFGCTQFFPEYEAKYQLVQQSDLHTQNGFIYTYCVYRR